MLADGALDGRNAAVVQQRPAQAQAPQARLPNFCGCRSALLDAVAGPDIVKQQIGEERHGLAVEERIHAGTGGQSWHMTARAANALEDSLPIARNVIDGAARHWREKAHEALEVIDAAAVRGWVAHVLGIRPRVAEAHLIRADPKSELTRKQIVGDAHLVPVRVGAEGKQRGVLCLPSEAADATVAGRYVGDDRRPAGY